MKHKILSRALSLTAAAALACTAAGGGVLSVLASPMQQESPPAVQQQDSDEPVSVIVRVAGDAVLEHPDAENAGMDFLETDLADQLQAECTNVQQIVQNSIRQFYPELEVGFSYTTLYNGFSCKLPANMLDRVRALPFVVSATEIKPVEMPQMDHAPAFSGYQAYCDMTGCTGEGQVIAVIDSELDVTHPMFAPLADGIETALTYENIADIAGSGALHIDVDPERAYINNKLPFVIDYVDDPYDGVANMNLYHGTHVSGIAAGNVFQTDDGKTLSGIAKDSQLIFFATSSGQGIAVDASMAAIEDAIKLHADVINMSWGAVQEHFEENPMTKVLAAADQAGIVICTSAGNDDNGTQSYGKVVTPEAPNYSTISDKGELGTPILLVASADNTCTEEVGTIVFNGQTFTLRPSINSFGVTTYLSDTLLHGEYEYVDCGTGSRGEMKKQDLSGKIALVQRGYYAFSDIAARAGEFGAIGVLISDKEHSDDLQYARSDSITPLSVITYQAGQMLREAENKVIRITGEKIQQDYPSKVSSYTSWGVKQSLDLRPDIMGIGGRVSSAAYEQSYQTMSGTSMSSPYVSGCAAVLREYLKKQGMELTGADFSAHIRRLMMNTAIPYEENGFLVTPRRQGAGMVSLDRAVQAKVLMTGDAGDAKVNLFDKIGTDFSFNVTLTNYSTEDVTFPQAELRLTTDDYYYDAMHRCNVLYGQQTLNSTAQFSAPFTVGAGQTATVKVQVSLDQAQYQSLKEIFKKGFFEEGYLMLSGAENSADISIPVFGFSDDWSQLDIADRDSIGIALLFGNRVFSAGLPIVEACQIMADVTARMNADDKDGDVLDFMTDEELHLLQYGRNETWVSANHDSIADAAPGIVLKTARWAKADTKIQDSDGNVIVDIDSNISNDPLFDVAYFGLLDGDADKYETLSNLAEGDYVITSQMYLNFGESANTPQEYRAYFHVDNTPPEVTSKIVHENDRTYLEIHAKDQQALQGILVSGIGQGSADGPVSSYQYSSYKDISNALYSYRNDVSNSHPVSYLQITGASDRTLDELPSILRLLGSIGSGEEDLQNDFYDVIAPEKGETGEMSLRYDVTGLSHYSFTVLDRAYNFAEIRSVEKSASELIGQDEIWQEKTRGFSFRFHDKKLTVTDYYDLSEKEYTLKSKKDTLEMCCGDTTKVFDVKKISDNTYLLSQRDGDEVYMLSRAAEGVSYKDTVPNYSIKEILEQIPKEAEAFWSSDTAEKEGFPVSVKGRPATILSYSVYNSTMLTVLVSYGENEDGGITTDTYEISLLSGRGSASFWDPHGLEKGAYVYSRDVNLFQQILASVQPGLYHSDTLNQYFLFNENGTDGMFLYSSLWGNCMFNVSEHDVPFTYTVSDDGIITFTCGDASRRAELYRGNTADDLYLCFLNDDSDSDPLYNYNLTCITKDPEQIAALCSSEELTELFAAYEKEAMGTEMKELEIDNDLVGTIKLEGRNNDDPNNRLFDSVTLDVLTLKGTDYHNDPVDLRHPPKLSKQAHSLDEITDAAIEYCSQDKEVISFDRKLISDDAVRLVLSDNNYGTSSYLVNAVTGFGIDTNGNLINLFPSDAFRCGDANCDGTRDVADAVLLARFLAEDAGASITETGRRNCDCNGSGTPDHGDVVLILKAIAKIISM